MNVLDISIAKKYTQKSLEGSGVLKGQKGDPGKDGKDAPTITNVSVDENNALSTTLSDGTVLHSGTIQTVSGKDGVDGKDGRSITAIITDKSNDIIITFSDGTVQNIGKLNIDIQADFLTSDGFGKLRYYNGKFQYYDDTLQKWVDAVATPQNTLVVNMIPNPMQFVAGVYDYDIGHYKLKWQEPEDTVVDGQVICLVEKVVIRRKLGSVPVDENDGDLVKVVEREDFGNQKDCWYADNSFAPNMGDVYYYKAFPASTTGFYNASSENETGGIKAKNYWSYGFTLDQSESDPASMIAYIEDNKKFRSAYMNYAEDKFDYGDWEDVDFIKNLKPCVLGFDGNVMYELNKNDYTKKIDGTNADISNDNLQGNVMIGVPKVYWKVTPIDDDKCEVHFSNKKLDADYHCWSHLDNNGNEIDYCYMPIYSSSNVNSKFRSLSGKSTITSQTAQAEINYTKANNLTNDIIWYTEVFSDRMLVNLLLLLIGKSTDTQTVFGSGNNNSYVSTSNTGIKASGTMNTKGLFWGNQDNKSGVKVFGMEHWWGNQWRRIAGWINDKGTQKIKMTYGQSDGSTVDGYNIDGNGYVTIPNAIPSGTNGGYISKMKFTENGLIPTTANGSATTYFCDALWFNNSKNGYTFVGSASNDGLRVGALCSNLDGTASYAAWGVGAAISCKPLATGGAS